MYKTLRISFSLKNTYRVNSILFAIKQIPLIKKILPDALYGVRGLKIFANIISVIWEVISVFLGKFLVLPHLLVFDRLINQPLRYISLAKQSLATPPFGSLNHFKLTPSTNPLLRSLATAFSTALISFSRPVAKLASSFI